MQRDQIQQLEKKRVKRGDQRCYEPFKVWLVSRSQTAGMAGFPDRQGAKDDWAGKMRDIQASRGRSTRCQASNTYLVWDAAVVAEETKEG